MKKTSTVLMKKIACLCTWEIDQDEAYPVPMDVIEIDLEGDEDPLVPEGYYIQQIINVGESEEF